MTETVDDAAQRYGMEHDAFGHGGAKLAEAFKAGAEWWQDASRRGRWIVAPGPTEYAPSTAVWIDDSLSPWTKGIVAGTGRG